MTKPVKLVRWRAVVPLVLLLVLVALLVWLFAEPVARETLEEVATETLGTQVEVADLDIDAGEVRVDLAGLAIADPFDPWRNVVEAEEVRVRLNPEALAEKKVVVERLSIGGVRFGTRRRTAAAPAAEGGFAVQALGGVRRWAERFDVPILRLAPLDTARQLVLNPEQLGTVRAARALAARADSSRAALEAELRALPVAPTIDSAQALAERLARTDPRRLGLAGTRRAVEDVRRTVAQLDGLQRRVEALGRSGAAAVGAVETGVRALDDARRRDHAFARGLLRLPSFEAPEIGRALFGEPSIDRFERALYYVELARHYMPPGLLPRAGRGPERLRAAGTSVRYPKARAYPAFLLRAGEIDLTIETGGLLDGRYEAEVQGITSAPRLYGRPAVFRLRRTAESAVRSIDVAGVSNALVEPRLDAADARLAGVELPDFELPGLPVRLGLGRGTSTLSFRLHGEALQGRWAIATDQVAWSIDTAGRALDTLERLVWRVVSGLRTLRLDAELRGTVRAPELSVRSNLDEAIAEQVQAVLGEELARAERLARTKVDSLADRAVAALERRLDSLRFVADERVGTVEARLSAERSRLERELRRLTATLPVPVPVPVDSALPIPRGSVRLPRAPGDTGRIRLPRLPTDSGGRLRPPGVPRPRASAPAAGLDALAGWTPGR